MIINEDEMQYPENNKYGGVMATFRSAHFTNDHYQIPSSWNFSINKHQRIPLQRFKDFASWMQMRHAMLRAWPHDHENEWTTHLAAIEEFNGGIRQSLPAPVANFLRHCIKEGWPRMRIADVPFYPTADPERDEHSHTTRETPLLIKTFSGPVTTDSMNELRNCWSRGSILGDQDWPPCVFVLWVRDIVWEQVVNKRGSKQFMESDTAFFTMYLSHQIADGSVVRGLLADVNDFLQSSGEDQLALIPEAPNACREVERRLMDTIDLGTTDIPKVGLDAEARDRIYNMNLWSHLQFGDSFEPYRRLFHIPPETTRALKEHLLPLGL